MPRGADIGALGPLEATPSAGGGSAQPMGGGLPGESNSAVASEAEQDAALEALEAKYGLGGGSDEDDDPGGYQTQFELLDRHAPGADDKGKTTLEQSIAASKRAEAEAAKESEEAAGDKPAKAEDDDEADAEPDEDVGTEQYEAAFQALRLDGYTREELREMDREQLLKVGAKAKARQSRADNTFRELKERIAQLEGTNGEAASAGEPAAAKPPVGLEPLAQRLGELVGADAEEAKGIVGMIGQYVDGKLGDVQKQNAAINERFVAMAVQYTRDQLAADNPRVRDDKVWDRIMAKAAEMGRNGATSVTEALRDAEMIIEGSRSRDALKRKTKAATKKQRNGLPTLGSRRTSRGAMSDDQRTDAVLDALWGDGSRSDRLARAQRLAHER